MERKKKRAIIFLVILCAIGVVSAIGMLLLNYFVEQEQKPKVYYYPEHMFETPDFSANIFEDEEYLLLDRDVYYTAYDVTRLASDVGTKYAEFWLSYFQILQNGDTDAYNALLADAYRERVGVQTKFTMQRVYNIEIELVSEVYPDENGSDYHMTVFLVKYYFSRNDGTFRRDVLSDGAGPQAIGLVEEDGELKIMSVVRIYG